MAGDATLPLQAALVATLKGAAAVSAFVGARVYDRAPQDVTFPYISLGAEIASIFDAADIDGREIEWQIDTWSRKAGRVETRQIMTAIADALHDQALAVSGHAFVMGRMTMQTTMDDPDGVTVHGVQKFRFITHA